MSGLMRTYLKCYESLLKHVILPNQADLFISTWSILGTGTYKVPGQPWILVPGPEENVDPESIKKVYGDHLKTLHIEEWQPLQARFRRELEESCRHAPHHVAHTDDMKGITRRLISMHYKIAQANIIRQQYETKNNIKYDVVIRARPDIRHNKTLLMENYATNFPHCYLDHTHSYGYVCDQFAFGASETMNRYASVYHFIYDYNNKIAVWNAENMMQYHLKMQGIAWEFSDLDYKVVGLIDR